MRANIVDPFTEDTITSSVPYDGANEGCTDLVMCINQNEKLCLHEGEEEYSLLDPCVNTLDKSVFVRTSQSWTDLGIRTGETIRIDDVDYVVETPRDDHVVTVSHPWRRKKQQNATTFYVNGTIGGNCTTRAYRQRATIVSQQWHDRPILPCCIATSVGSNIALVSGKLKDHISVDMVLGVRGEAFRILDLESVMVTDEMHITLSATSIHSSCSGMMPRQLDQCTKLPGRAVLTFNSTSVVTTNDLSKLLQPRDRILFGHPELSVEKLFTVSGMDGGVTKHGFDLPQPWMNADTGTLLLYKCDMESKEKCEQVGEKDCPRVVLRKDEAVVTTECDISGELEIGDEISLCGVVHEISFVAPTGDRMTLANPWKGRNADPSVEEDSCQMCKRPRTEAQEIMEEYNEKYGRCESVLCMARLEAEERSLGKELQKEEKITSGSVNKMEEEETRMDVDVGVAVAVGVGVGAVKKSDALMMAGGEAVRGAHKGTTSGNIIESTKTGDGSTNTATTTSAIASATTTSTSPTLLSPIPQKLPSLPNLPSLTDNGIPSTKQPDAPFGDINVPIPDVHLTSEGKVIGGIDENDPDTPLLNAIKGPLDHILQQVKSKKDNNDKDKKLPSLPSLPIPTEEEDEEEDDLGDDMDDDLDEDGTPTNSKSGDTTPKPGSGSQSPPSSKLPKHEQDAAFDTMKPSKVPPGASKTFKRFMKCELCGKDNDVMNPLFMLNPSSEAPPSSEEYMKKKTKAAETMDAQSTPPGYIGAPNKPWHKPADEMSANHGSGIKFCPDDWLDLGVGDHIYPIDKANGEPTGHKCQNLLNIGKCKEDGALISDIAMARGMLDEPPGKGTYVEDFSEEKFTGWYGKYVKCNFARTCKTPWKGYDHLCGVTRKWLKQTEQNYAHRFNEGTSDEHPVKWPERL